MKLNACFLCFFVPLLWADSGIRIYAEENNLERTEAISAQVTQFLTENKVLVAVLGRRGKIIDAKLGISDVDKYDATGMAHLAFVIRAGFSGEDQYITLNLVSTMDQNGKTSDLRAWSLNQFFVVAGEKDALILLPSRQNQMKLWNEVRRDMTFENEDVTIGKETITRQAIRGGLFQRFHNPSYNLLSDFAYNQSQNCSEHLVKTLASVVRQKPTLEEVSLDLELNYQPYHFKVGGIKLWLARHLKNMPLKGGERKGKFHIITVESMLAQRDFLGIESIQVFRERMDLDGYHIDDLGGDYIKKNRITGKPNPTHF